MESTKEVAGYPPSKAALRLCSAARSPASLPTAGSSAPIDITGSPEEQLTYVTERLLEIGLAGKRAEDFTVLNKAVLLEVAQERELHLVAGPYPLLGVGGGRARIEPKYGFELLQDAARIRAVSELGPGHTQHQGKASIRQVMAEVIADQGLGAAQIVMSEGVARASEQGTKHPNRLAARLDRARPDHPLKPAAEAEVRNSDLAAEPPIPAPVAALERAAASVKERLLATGTGLSTGRPASRRGSNS